MIRIPLAAILLAAALASPSAGETAESWAESGDIASELARLNETLLRVQELMEQQLETQTLDLLLKRSQLVSAEVARLDQQLRAARSQRDSLQDDQARMLEQLERFEDEVRSGRHDMATEELDAIVDHHRSEIRRISSRLDQVEREVAELELRLDRQNEELRSWNEILDRRLAGQ